MAELRALVPAAGLGSRARLPYPKTLFRVQGIEILVRVCDVLAPYDNEPTIIVSPSGEEPIRQCLTQHGTAAHLVVQPEARGMGDAVLRFTESPAFEDTEHVLLIWGDIPFIQPETVAAAVAAHKAQGNHFTFATRQAESAYTVVIRDPRGRVTRVVETREEGRERTEPGERDIGLFVFRKTVVLNMLREELSGKWGRSTSEHGFLYVIGHMVSRGLRVAALPIATKLDLVSFNTIKDIDAYLK